MADALKLTCHACGTANRLPADRLDAAPRCGVCGTRLADGRVHEIDLATLEKSRKDDLPLLVDFWAAWCGPCRMMAPQFSAAARMLLPEARLAKLDTEAHPGASDRYDVRGIPLLILFHRGREVARLAGARPAEEIVKFVRHHVGQTA